MKRQANKQTTKKMKMPVQKAPSAQHAQHSYFVLLHYPEEFRRALLEASRTTIYSLQRYHRIKLLREQKKQEIARVKSQLKELTFLVGKLTEQLPPDLIPPRPIAPPAPHQLPERRVSSTRVLPAQADELDKLTVHLLNIEERLKRL